VTFNGGMRWEPAHACACVHEHDMSIHGPMGP